MRLFAHSPAPAGDVIVSHLKLNFYKNQTFLKYVILLISSSRLPRR